MFERAADFVPARAAAEELRVRADRDGRKDMVAWALQSLGHSHLQERRYDASKESYSKAADIARSAGLPDMLVMALHGLGLLHWEKSDRQLAFIEWKRELEARSHQPVIKIAEATYFVAQKYESFNRTQAIAMYDKIVEMLDRCEDPHGLLIRAESAHQLARLRLHDQEWGCALADADLALACYEHLTDHAYNLPWCQRLRAVALEGLGREEEVTAAVAEAERLTGLSVSVRNIDQLRTHLSSALDERDPARKRALLLNAEMIALDIDLEAQVEFSMVAGLIAWWDGNKTNGLDLLKQRIGLERGIKEWRDAAGQADFHHIAADVFRQAGSLTEAHACACKAFELNGRDPRIALQLATLDLELGRVMEMDRIIPHLRQLGVGEDTLMDLNAQGLVKRGDFKQATTVFDDLHNLTRDKEWISWRNECMTVIGNPSEIDSTQRIGPLFAQGQTQGIEVAQQLAFADAPQPILPEDEFYKFVLMACANWTLACQATAPKYVQAYLKDKENSLLEDDFRDEFKRAIQTRFPETRGEESRTRGRSDLLVPSDDGMRRRVRFEFKVWGRRHATVVDQLLDYIADDEDIGVVYMIDPLLQKDIWATYRQIVIMERRNYVASSLRVWPVFPQHQSFYHLLSKHLLPSGREVDIYHFIYRIQA